ncbi:MAG: very short patch repair endonuclease [Nocardioides sp.]
MAGRWVSTEAGTHLAGRRKEGTKPEVLVRRAVHAAGGRFRLHRRLAKGCTPDFVMPSRRVAVFVDGCFWHDCPAHGRRTPWAGPNAELWAQKMQRNAKRDRRADQLAQLEGWRVIRVWECAAREDASAVARTILQWPEQGLLRLGPSTTAEQTTASRHTDLITEHQLEL